MWQFPWTTLWSKSEVLIRTKKKTYSLDNMEELFNDLGSPEGWEMYKNLEPFMTNLEDPGVPVYCIYGVGFKTVESIYYSGSILDSFTKAKCGNGDGIVNLRSFEVCKQWKNAEVKPFWGVNHFTIQSNSRVIEYIIEQINKS
ncbi:hypothetical protein V9T40_008898 [Parthenolecanium corni]|uniref:Uncharacterized protein n=1 Tax=Parthenolecanium corni TaxID=536013 RepID=A0AAN9Y8A7_9HEMI